MPQLRKCGSHPLLISTWHCLFLDLVSFFDSTSLPRSFLLLFQPFPSNPGFYPFVASLLKSFWHHGSIRKFLPFSSCFCLCFPSQRSYVSRILSSVLPLINFGFTKFLMADTAGRMPLKALTLNQQDATLPNAKCSKRYKTQTRLLNKSLRLPKSELPP
jgi:hypothetical protein